MNEANPTSTFPSGTFAPQTSPKTGFNTHLSFYHANAKNTGAAIQFSMEPATPERDGAVYFSLARQKTVASNEGERRFASFDWSSKATVKLGFVEVAEMLLVLCGQAPALGHAGKEGIFHTSPTAPTTISLKRSEDPTRPGFLLGVGRTPKADPNARQYYSITLWPAEAFGLRAALLAQMGLLAFGVPKERPGAQPIPFALGPAPAAATPGAFEPSMPDAMLAEAV